MCVCCVSVGCVACGLRLERELCARVARVAFRPCVACVICACAGVCCVRVVCACARYMCVCVLCAVLCMCVRVWFEYACVCARACVCVCVCAFWVVVYV